MLRRPIDPRLFQVASLGMLLAANIALFDLAATIPQSAVMLIAILGWQALFCRLFRQPFDPLSPAITGLSLGLLLRTHDPALWIAAPGIAIGSKFLLRLRGKHLFNPANAAIVTLLAMGAEVWVSPGQWGTALWLAAIFVSLGGLVLARARRLDTAGAFFVCYAGLLAMRAMWLGDPWAIPLHQLQSGALLLFTCFMITDPRSTPDHPMARVVFAASVAALAYHLQFVWQVRTGLFYALATVSLMTPLLDWLCPAQRFRWRYQEAPCAPSPLLP